MLGATLSSATFSSFVSADEGMWLFNNPPRKLLREKYQFEPAADWYEHLQKASVSTAVARGRSFRPAGW
jgi:hypothetical protein